MNQEAAETAHAVAILWDGPHDTCFVCRGGFTLVMLDDHRRWIIQSEFSGRTKFRFNYSSTVNWIFCYSNCALSYIHYINQQMHSIKYTSQNLVHGKYQILHVSAPKCHLQGVC